MLINRYKSRKWQLKNRKNATKSWKLDIKQKIEQLREAGHSTLSVIVEEYKSQSQLAVAQERERSEGLLQEAMTREMEKSQQKLQEQHDRYYTELIAHV